MSPELKTCRCCNIPKPPTEFHARGKGHNGTDTKCKDCFRILMKERYRSDPEKHKAGMRDYVARNREKVREIKRAYAERTREAGKARHRAWSEKNRDKTRAKEHLWRATHPDKSRLKVIRRRARAANAEGQYTVEQWQNLKEKYGYCCLKCRKREPEIKLTIDHVVPLSRGGSNAITNIQPLCYDCNMRKSTRIADYRPTFCSTFADDVQQPRQHIQGHFQLPTL